jgi:hypothetical protein
MTFFVNQEHIIVDKYVKLNLNVAINVKKCAIHQGSVLFLEKIFFKMDVENDVVKNDLNAHISAKQLVILEKSVQEHYVKLRLDYIVSVDSDGSK